MKRARYLLTLVGSTLATAAFSADSDTTADMLMGALAADRNASPTYLADRQQIEDLMVAYAVAHNTTNPDLYRRIFTEDAQWVSSSGKVLMTGIDKIVAMVNTDRVRFNAKAEPGKETYGNMRHYIGNLVVHIQGDTATAHSYVLNTAYNTNAKRPEILSDTLRYKDELVKKNGEWRIRKRTMFTLGGGNDELARIIGVGPYTPKEYR